MVQKINVILSLVPAVLASWVTIRGSIEGGYSSSSLGPQNLKTQASILSFNGPSASVLNTSPLFVSPSGNTYVVTPFSTIADDKMQVLGFGMNSSFVSSYQYPGLEAPYLTLQDDNTVWVPTQGLLTGDL